jgi:hypothetical protein
MLPRSSTVLLVFSGNAAGMATDGAACILNSRKRFRLLQDRPIVDHRVLSYEGSSFNKKTTGPSYVRPRLRRS